MPEADTSSYQDYAKAPNPLTQLGGITDTVNKMNQNKLFQQTLQGRQAYGAALAKNTDPSTGEINYPGVNTDLAAAGPAAALALPEASSAALERQKGQAQLTKDQITAMQSKHALIGPQFADLASNPNPTMDDVYALGGNLMAGTKTHPSPISLNDVQQELASLPPNPTPKQIQAWAMRQAIRSTRLAGADPSQYLPKPTAITTNTGTTMADTNPVTNPGIVGASVQQGLPPTAEVYNPNTKQNQLLGPQPAPQLQTPGTGLVANGSPAPAPSVQQTPLQAPPSPNAPPPAAGLAASQVPPPPPGIELPGNAPLATGPALGTEAAENAAGTITGGDLGKDRIAAKNGINTLYNMKQALTQLKAAPTGPGTESLNALKGFINAFDPTGLVNISGIGDDNKAYDEANKYLTAQAQGLAAAVGPNTNENLSTALTGSPNTHINNLAAQDVQKTMIALTRMNIARTMAFDQNPNANANDYEKFGAQWNKSIDPRAFMADVMPPKQLKALLDDPKFADTYRNAVKAGLLDHTDVVNNIKNGQ